MEREKLLQDHTHKDENLDTPRRVYYTLTGVIDLTGHRCAKAIGVLLDQLVKAGHITADQLDDLLLEVVQ